MDPRYEDPEIREIFREQSKYDRWYREIVRAMHARYIKEPTAQGAADRAAARPAPSAARVQQIEQTVGHDVAAFLQACAEGTDDEEFRRLMHYGMTSSDIVDNAHHEALFETTTRLLQSATYLQGVLWNLTRKHEATYMLGRTHGQVAEPTTFGHRMNVFLTMAERAQRNLRDIRNGLMIRKTPGAVGTHAIYNGRMDHWMVKSTQVIPRDIQVHWAFHAVQLVSVCESIAMEIRLLSGQGLQEVVEGGAAKRTGSSAMPHKQNPIGSENICGLARVARAYLFPLMETVVTFHDRDISNSSVERIATVDLAHLTMTIVKRTTRLLRDLKVNEEAMYSNLAHAGARPYSSVAVSILQDMGISYVAAHSAVRLAYQDWIPYTGLISVVKELGLDFDEFNAMWQERATPQWMTRNVRRGR